MPPPRLCTMSRPPRPPSSASACEQVVKVDATGSTATGRSAAHLCAYGIERAIKQRRGAPRNHSANLFAHGGSVRCNAAISPSPIVSTAILVKHNAFGSRKRQKLWFAHNAEGANDLGF